MPIASINEYLDKLEVRMAEKKLMMADVGMLPHIKSGDRNTTLKRWMRTANIQALATARVATPGQLRMIGIGVEFVKPE